MKTKKVEYEILRCISILLVIYAHTSYRGFELYTISGTSGLNYSVSLLMAGLCKMCIPLFFMISGGFLLHRNEEVGVVLKKRVLRIFLALVVFSVIQYCYRAFRGFYEAPGIHHFFQLLWHDGSSIPYWYLYAFLSLMLMLPFLRPMVQGMTDRAFHYLIGLHLLYYCILTPLGLFLGFGNFHSDFFIPMAERTIFYFVMGYYMTQRFQWENVERKHMLLLLGLSIFSLAVMYGLSDWSYRTTGETRLTALNALVCIPAFTIYIGVCRFCRAHTLPGWLEKLFCTVGGCTFGVYLLEGILRNELLPLFEALEPRIHVLPACAVWILAVLTSGCVIVLILKKLPGFKQLL